MLLPINKTTSATKYRSFTENRKLQARCQFSKMVGTLTYCLWFFNLMYWYIINTQYLMLYTSMFFEWKFNVGKQTRDE